MLHFVNCLLLFSTGVLTDFNLTAAVIEDTFLIWVRWLSNKVHILPTNYIRIIRSIKVIYFVLKF